jgi:hypothetical protein
MTAQPNDNAIRGVIHVLYAYAGCILAGVFILLVVALS